MDNLLHNHLLKKYVVLGMNNGFLLEGFADSFEFFEGQGYFLILFENNNNKVFVKMNDITFSRIIGDHAYMPREPRSVPPTQNTEYFHQNPPINDNNEEYSMPMNRIENNPFVRKPELNRSRR